MAGSDRSSTLIAALLTAVLIFTGPPKLPPTGTASWYGARCLGVTFLGRQDTCSPYLSVAQGGRGGEQWFYAAVGTWRWKDRPYRMQVCRADDPRRCVTVTVRDHCERCKEDLGKPWGQKSRVIDLSPLAFAALADLGRGLVRVVLKPVRQQSNTESQSTRGQIGYR